MSKLQKIIYVADSLSNLRGASAEKAKKEVSENFNKKFFEILDKNVQKFASKENNLLEVRDFYRKRK